MYLFSLCVWVFFPFFSFLNGGGGRVFFSIFHLSHLVEFSALISSLWYGVRRFRNNCQVQIKNGWSGCNIELLNTSRDLSDGYGTRFFFFFSSSPPLLPLPLSAPGVSLCSQNNAWVMSALGRRCSVQRFSTNASHNDHVLLPLCTSSIGSTPLEKSERHKQLQRLLPFSQLFTTAALLHYQTDGGSSSSPVQALRNQQVRSGNRQNARAIRTQPSCGRGAHTTHTPYAAHLLAHVHINKCRLFCISWHTHSNTHTCSV